MSESDSVSLYDSECDCESVLFIHISVPIVKSIIQRLTRQIAKSMTDVTG